MDLLELQLTELQDCCQTRHFKSFQCNNTTVQVSIFWKREKKVIFVLLSSNRSESFQFNLQICINHRVTGKSFIFWPINIWYEMNKTEFLCKTNLNHCRSKNDCLEYSENGIELPYEEWFDLRFKWTNFKTKLEHWPFNSCVQQNNRNVNVSTSKRKKTPSLYS